MGQQSAQLGGKFAVLEAIKREFSPNRAQTSIWIAFAGLMASLLAFDAHPRTQGGLFESFWRTTDDIAEYFAYAVAFFVVFWVGLDRLIQGRKLSRRRWPKRTQVISETIFSLVSQFIFLSTVLWMASLFMPEMRRSHMYTDISEYGLAYYALTLFLVFFIHDTAFYWSHRFMHTEKMYRWVHKTHHESRNPTPFTTFHFHPIEALFEAIAGQMILVVLILMPWHASVPAIWATGMIFFNSVGHLGYELYPSWWHRIPLLRQKTTGMHHYMHHQRVGGNYALYFRFWDQVCGTEFKDYEARYDRMFERIAARTNEKVVSS